MKLLISFFILNPIIVLLRFLGLEHVMAFLSPIIDIERAAYLNVSWESLVAVLEEYSQLIKNIEAPNYKKQLEDLQAKCRKCGEYNIALQPGGFIGAVEIMDLNFVVKNQDHIERFTPPPSLNVEGLFVDFKNCEFNGVVIGSPFFIGFIWKPSSYIPKINIEAKSCVFHFIKCIGNRVVFNFKCSNIREEIKNHNMLGPNFLVQKCDFSLCTLSVMSADIDIEIINCWVGDFQTNGMVEVKDSTFSSISSIKNSSVRMRLNNFIDSRVRRGKRDALVEIKNNAIGNNDFVLARAISKSMSVCEYNQLSWFSLSQLPDKVLLFVDKHVSKFGESWLRPTAILIGLTYGILWHLYGEDFTSKSATNVIFYPFKQLDLTWSNWFAVLAYKVCQILLLVRIGTGFKKFSQKSD